MFNASPVDSAVVRVPDLSNTDSYYGQRITYLATASDTRGAFLLLDATERRGLELPMHVHENEDETVILLEGEASFHVGDQTFLAHPGDVVFMPRGVPHGHTVVTEEIRALLLVTPGAMEGYYRALIRQAEGKSGVPEVKKVGMIGSAYGIEFIGDGKGGHSTRNGSGMKPFHARSGEGEILNVLGIRTQVMLSGAETAKSFSLFVTHDLPNYGPPMHVHHNEHESFVVLEGEYILQVADERYTAKAGAFVHMPKEVPHTYARVSPEKGKLLVLTMPSGFEKFFRGVDALPPLADGTPDLAGLQKVAEKHGLDIIGPPITIPQDPI